MIELTREKLLEILADEPKGTELESIRVTKDNVIIFYKIKEEEK